MCTSDEEDLQLRWKELATAEAAHDQAGAVRAWELIRELRVAIARRLGGGAR